MSTDLIGLLTSQLGVTGSQAKGGAGLLLGVARDRLSAGQFSELTRALPGLDSLLGAAPQGGGGLMGMLGKAVGGQAGDLATLAGGFSKLGMDTGMIQKFIPVIMSWVQQQGGAGAMALLQQALKR
jgi:hypothetical protein